MHDLGFKSVRDIRAGKHIEVKIEENSFSEAKEQVEEMCRKLLANPVIENFRFEIDEI